MTDDRMALVDLLQKSGDGDFLRSVAEAVLQIPMEADVEGLIGAERHERTGDRLNYRNGYRERSLDTGLARCNCASPSCAKDHTSRRSWSRARPPRRRWSR
jgi:putative transposase